MRLSSRWVSVAVLLAAFGTRVHLVTKLATQTDEGLHIAAAEQIRSGAVIYKDLFENRTPLVEWLLAVVFRLTGNDILVARLLAIGAAMITTAAIIAAGYLVKKLVAAPHSRDNLVQTHIGNLGGILFALSPFPIFWSRYAMLEHFQTAAGLIGIVFTLLGIRHSRKRYWLLSGLFVGVAILAKQTGVLLAAVVGLYLLWMLIVSRGGNYSAAAVSWAAGLLAALLSFAVMLLIQDSGSNFIRFLSGTDRLNPVQDLPEKMTLLRGLLTRHPSVPLALVGIGGIVWKRDSRLLLLPLWAGFELAAIFLPGGVSLSWGGFSHYLIPVMASASLLAAGGLAALYHATARLGPQATTFANVAVLLLTAVSAPAWLADLRYAVSQVDYPEIGFSTEARIGQAAAALTAQDQSIVVLANPIFYHWAARPPASLYFHYPAYLADSALGADSDRDITNALADERTAVVLVSRKYLEERLSPAISIALWHSWTPAALFSYAYQRDVFLFLPNSNNPIAADQDSLAEFDQGITLQHIEAIQAGKSAVLVALTWVGEEPLTRDYAVFVHVVGNAGDVVGQHDGIPENGFRPTSSWQVGETITDWHWIELPDDAELSGLQLNIGMYQIEDGQRLHLRDELSGVDSFNYSDVRTVE